MGIWLFGGLIGIMKIFVLFFGVGGGAGKLNKPAPVFP